MNSQTTDCYIKNRFLSYKYVFKHDYAKNITSKVAYNRNLLEMLRYSGHLSNDDLSDM